MNRPRAWIPGSGRLIASAAKGLRRAWGLGFGLMLPLVLALAVMLSFAGLQPQPAWAGPVEWQEVPATEAGRQWWDRGSLRLSKQGTLTVLSRFQPAAEPGPTALAQGPATLPKPTATSPGQAPAPQAPDQGAGAAPARPPRQPNSQLYVSEIDCDQGLMRDTSINGIPQWRANWQPVAGDGLMEAVVQAVCEAGSPLLSSR
jgi:hypothetical protein